MVSGAWVAAKASDEAVVESDAPAWDAFDEVEEPLVVESEVEVVAEADEPEVVESEVEVVAEADEFAVDVGGVRGA